MIFDASFYIILFNLLNLFKFHEIICQLSMEQLVKVVGSW